MADSGYSTVVVIGIAVAAVLSWIRNTSVGYCILHGICGWFYVIYYLLTR